MAPSSWWTLIDDNEAGHPRMEGKALFHQRVGMVTDAVRGCFEHAGVSGDAIDRFAPR
jgi:3-oxoacyl-[acyl-carrier-protein] synthase III